MKRWAIAMMIASTGLTACGSPVLSVPVGMTSQQTQSQFFFGWWGESGRQRALTKFSKEEGRQVRWIADERGTRMDVQLTAGETQVLTSLLSLGPGGAKTIGKRDVPDGMYRKAVRHLKLFRRQKATHDSSRTMTMTRHATPEGQTLAFSVASRNGYQAFYTDKGRLMLAFVPPNPSAEPDPVAAPEDFEPDE